MRIERLLKIIHQLMTTMPVFDFECWQTVDCISYIGSFIKPHHYSTGPP